MKNEKLSKTIIGNLKIKKKAYIKTYLKENLHRHIKTGVEGFLEDPSDEEDTNKFDHLEGFEDVEVMTIQDKKLKKMMKIKIMGKKLI